MKWAVATATVFGAVIAGAAAGPVDIRIDFGTSVGVTEGHWNNVVDVTGVTSGLIDYVTGLPTEVAVGASAAPCCPGSDTSWIPGGGDDAGDFPEEGWLVQPAARDGAVLKRALASAYEFSGLTGAAYRVEVVSARSTFEYLSIFGVNGERATRTHLGTPVPSGYWNSTTDGLDAGNWLIWDDVVPVNGTIRITVLRHHDTSAIINAVRIVETPAARPTAVDDATPVADGEPVSGSVPAEEPPIGPSNAGDAGDAGQPGAGGTPTALTSRS